MKRFIVFIALLQFALVLKAQPDWATLMDDGFNLCLNASGKYDYWIPDKAASLKYYTEGFQAFKVEAILSHTIDFLPVFKWKWETNFGNSTNQKSLLKAHNTHTKLESVYNRMHFAIGLGKKIDNWHPFLPRTTFELSYTKETFLVQVTPIRNLYYWDFNDRNPEAFNRGQRATMFTKFEAIRGTFNTNGVSILPTIITMLFSAGQAEVLELGDKVETRFGLFYSQFQKPYTITQVVSGGNVSGNENTIYNARFRSYGLTETWNAYWNYFFMNVIIDFGISTIHLNNSLKLKDSGSPLFFYYKNLIGMGFFIPFGNRVQLNISGDFDWSWMFGGTYNAETEKMEANSFLNADIFFKGNAALVINI